EFWDRVILLEHFTHTPPAQPRLRQGKQEKIASHTRRCSVPSATLDPRRLYFPDTASRPGRHLAVSPKNSDLEYLHYARIRLAAGFTATTFETGPRETGLLCMKGSCRLRVTLASTTSEHTAAPQSIE